MRHLLSALVLLPLALVTSGCVYALAASSHPTDVGLRLRTSQPEQYVARVDLNPPADYPFAADGRVKFTVPQFRNGCTVYCLGVKTRDGDPEARRVIALIQGKQVVRRLSLAEISELPLDETGYRPIEVGN